MVFFGGPKRSGPKEYQGETGYGFAFPEGLATVDRGLPDSLRRDFISGSQDNEFWIELPRGKYNMLLISGDEEGETLTHITLIHRCGKISGEILGPGQYQCRIIPFTHEKDGVFKIGLSTENKYTWKLNALFLNKEYSYY